MLLTTGDVLVTFQVAVGNPGETNLNLTFDWGDKTPLDQELFSGGLFNNGSLLELPSPVTSTIQHRFPLSFVLANISSIRLPILITAEHDASIMIDTGEGSATHVDVTVFQERIFAPIPANLPSVQIVTNGALPTIIVFPAEPTNVDLAQEPAPLDSSFTDIIDVSFDSGIGDIGKLVLRFVFKDPKDNKEFEVPFSILGRDNLKSLFLQLRDEHIQILLIRPDGSELIFVDQYLRDGRPFDPNEDTSRVDPQNGDSTEVVSEIDVRELLKNVGDTDGLAKDGFVTVTTDVGETDAADVDVPAAVVAPIGEATERSSRVLRVDDAQGAVETEEADQSGAAASAAFGVLALGSIRSGFRRRMRQSSDDQPAPQLSRIGRLLRQNLAD